MAHSIRSARQIHAAINDARRETEQQTDSAYYRGLRLMRIGHYEKAIDLLQSAGRSPDVRNALGVCLLRLGQPEAAIRVYRSYVMPSGCTWVRPELGPEHVLNFATALLLGGHPAGCLEILHELRGTPHPMAEQLRSAMRQWAARLPFWKRFNWKFGRLEPDNSPVSLDFIPGALEAAAPVVETSGNGVTAPAAITMTNLMA